MAKKHILLIDDEIDFAKTMAMHLELRDYDVVVANDTDDALNKAKEKPDLILLDVMMPRMNGYEMCHRLRHDSITKNIPIIMLTAKKLSKDKVEGLHTGADDYITKSSDMEELFARIEALLRRSGLSEEMDKDKANLIEELKHIIREESVEVVFQPISYLRGRDLFAYEVLTRGPAQNLLEDPVKLFQSALRCGLLFELEMMCRKKALKKIGNLIDKKIFFFNNSPYLIESDKFKEVASLYSKPARIVLEITERAEIKNFQIFCRKLNSIKREGFKIALDDVGSGYSSLDSVAEMEPDYAKIDSALVHDIDGSPKKQNLVKAILGLCKQNGIVSIGEGIETEKELNTLLDLGVDAGQGYLLGRPLPELPKE